MDPVTSVRISWRAIVDHSLRSMLTTLGVIIGVGAVITFVILGASLEAEIVRTVAGENTDLVYVSATSGEGANLAPLGSGGQAVFTEHDVDLLRGLSGVRWAIPRSGIAASNIRYRDDVVGRQFVTVTTADYFEARQLTVVEGRAFADGTREVVMNREAAEMFAENVSVGENITIVRAATGEELNATVVGIVAEPRSDTSVVGGFGSRTGPTIYAPTRPFYEREVVSPATDDHQLVFPQIIVVVSDVRDIEATAGRIQTELATSGDVRVLKPEGYRVQVTTYDQLVDQIKQISSTFTAYIAGVAVISLVVGAIGIANIMLVSVTERRREIGIMKAIGAERADVLQLFLNEAIMLGLIGAILGAILGIVTGWAATEVIELPYRVRPGWFLAAIVVGVLIGIAAGVYPAWRAATVDPIDALRYE